MKFSCDKCKYNTNNKSNFNKHNTSSKHIKNSKNNNEIKITNFKCQFCNVYFSNVSNLYRHTKKCIIGNILEASKIETNNISKEIEFLKEKNAILEKHDKEKDKHIDFYKSITATAGSAVKSSMSALTYAIKKYNISPQLESMEDYTILYITDKNKTEADCSETFAKNLIYNHNHNLLHAYLGEFIISYYKKDDPTKQSIWNSDCSRLTYIIRELMNNKLEWQVDKKGVRTCAYIIDPLLTYIKTFLTDYISKKGIDMKKSSDAREMVRIMEYQGIAIKIIGSIDDKSLANNINKYIAPQFYLNKSDVDNDAKLLESITVD